MGKFIDSTSAKHPSRRKPLQTCTMNVIIDVDDTLLWEAAVSDWPDAYTMRIIRVDSWIAHAEIDYTYHGANRTDISRRVNATELSAMMGATRTVKL